MIFIFKSYQVSAIVHDLKVEKSSFVSFDREYVGLKDTVLLGVKIDMESIEEVEIDLKGENIEFLIWWDDIHEAEFRDTTKDIEHILSVLNLNTCKMMIDAEDDEFLM